MGIFGIIALASSLLGTGLGVVGGIKAQKAEADARKMQAAMDAVKAQREKTQQVRQMLRARAEILQAGEATGSEGSSAIVGGAASAQTAAFGNIAYTNTQEQFGRAMALQSQKRAEAAGVATLGQGISAVGGAIGMAGVASDIFQPFNAGTSGMPKEFQQMQKIGQKGIF